MLILSVSRLASGAQLCSCLDLDNDQFHVAPIQCGYRRAEPLRQLIALSFAGACRQQLIHRQIEDLSDALQCSEIRLASPDGVIAVSPLAQPGTARNLRVGQAKPRCSPPKILCEYIHRNEVFLTGPTRLCMFRTDESRQIVVTGGCK